MFGDLLEPVALRPWVLYTYGIHRNPGAEHERQGRISRESGSLLQPCRVTMQYDEVRSPGMVNIVRAYMLTKRTLRE